MNNPNYNYDRVCYNKNFLKKVIARVDFLSPISKIEKNIPKTISEDIKSIFPIAEPRKVVAQELQISKNGTKEKRSELTEWRFHSKKRDKTLMIHPQFLWISYSKYSSFEQFKKEFFGILSNFFKFFDEAQGQRVGLRYINEINLDEKEPLSWEKYINNDLLCLNNFSSNQENISRIFSNIEYTFDDYFVKFQFGIHNPDYPAPILQKQFILDYDAYYQGVLNLEDITSSFDQFHKKIQELFELSIYDELRDILNGKKISL
jgi:uncharacterized protein (TIGR04255 family)